MNAPTSAAALAPASFALLAVASLFGLKPRMPQPLFWAAMLAAVGLLALRLTSDHAWWTGHLFYELPPR